MTTPDQQLTRRLADMKSFLEKRIREQEEELKHLRSFLEVVDILLTERSFRRVDVTSAPVPQTKTEPSVQKSDSVPIMTVDGVRIASMVVEQNVLHITPEPELLLDSNSPPLRAFLIGKVLEPMLARDKESATTGALSPDHILSYSVDQTDGVLKAIHVCNYGDERRLLEFKNAVRWTFRRMYEREKSAKA
jgi:hypothetical protein